MSSSLISGTKFVVILSIVHGKKNRKIDKIIDGIILVLKVVGKTTYFFWHFPHPGEDLYYVRLGAFSIFVILSVVIIFSFAIECFLTPLDIDTRSGVYYGRFALLLF